MWGRKRADVVYQVHGELDVCLFVHSLLVVRLVRDDKVGKSFTMDRCDAR